MWWKSFQPRQLRLINSDIEIIFLAEYFVDLFLCMLLLLFFYDWCSFRSSRWRLLNSELILFVNSSNFDLDRIALVGNFVIVNILV